MMKKLVAATLIMAAAGSACAQGELDFNGINTGATATAVPAAITPPPPDAAGQGAPYWGNSYEYGRWNYSNYNRYNELKRRYDWVHRSIKRQRGYYARGSYMRQVLDNHEDYGERLWKQYKRYQDQNSAWQLELWCGQWEQYLGQQGWGYNNGGWNDGGWNDGGWNNGGWNNGGWQVGGSWGNGGWSVGGSWGYTYPDYGYYDNYNRWYYGNNNYYPYYGNRAYTDGYLLGNSIGNIVNGSRYDNNLQLTAGILGTVGNSINIFNDARGW